MEIGSKKTGPIQVAIISHVGSYGEVGRLYQEIAGWLGRKKQKITGPPLGWFYDNPAEVPAHKLRSEVGFPFEGEAKAEGNITIKRIPAQEVLYALHKGTYGEVEPVYSALFKHADEKGYVSLGCPIEIYLNDPAKVPESELLTEVQLPIRRS